MEEKDRKNRNRGYKKLRVWQDAISLYVISSKMLSHFPFEFKKVSANAIDACHSISRNIAEGYCRRNLKEYLNFLNISLGSCGEFHSAYYSFYKADQISKDEFETLDKLHYKIENQLIKLIEKLQNKSKNGDWEDSFA